MAATDQVMEFHSIATKFPTMQMLRVMLCALVRLPGSATAITTAVYLHPADLSCDDPDLQDTSH